MQATATFLPVAESRGLPLAVMVGVLAFLAFGVISTVKASNELDPQGVLAPVDVAAEAAAVAPIDAPTRTRTRCDACGIVESMHRIDPGAGGAVYYDIAVRLRDGTLRHSQDASPGRWQVGDRALAMGGDTGRVYDTDPAAATLIR